MRNLFLNDNLGLRHIVNAIFWTLRSKSCLLWFLFRYFFIFAETRGRLVFFLTLTYFIILLSAITNCLKLAHDTTISDTISIYMYFCIET